MCEQSGRDLYSKWRMGFPIERLFRGCADPALPLQGHWMGHTDVERKESRQGEQYISKCVLSGWPSR